MVAKMKKETIERLKDLEMIEKTGGLIIDYNAI